MERITNQGSLSYRTKLLSLAKAAAFAKALGENSRFAAVSIETSTRAKSDSRYFVQFNPSNPERIHDMRERQQNARALRACEQGFTFVLDKDAGRPFFWCHSHTSGEVYELGANAETCNCPDHTYRCAPLSLKCKHQLALLNADPDTLRTW